MEGVQWETLSKKYTDNSVYFLSSNESKVRTYCDICKSDAEGIACFMNQETKLASIIVKCHKKTFGLRVTFELLSSKYLIGGFMICEDSKLRAITRIQRMDPIITKHTLILEEAIRHAKEKVFKQIHGSGSFINPDQFEVIKGTIHPGANLEEIEEEVNLMQETRRIILED